MVDGIEGFIMEDGEGAGGESANQEGAEEAGGVGDGDGVNFIPGKISVLESFIYDWEHNLEVISGGDFGDNTTVFFEDVDLGNDDIT